MSFRRVRSIYFTSAGAIILCLYSPDPSVRYTAGVVVLLGAWPMFQAITRAVRHQAREQLFNDLVAYLAPTLARPGTPPDEPQESGHQ
jgi:hypothetical protein